MSTGDKTSSFNITSGDHNAKLNSKGSEEFNESSSDGTLEKAELLSRERRVSLFTAVKLRFAAIFASWVSVVCGLAQGAASCFLAIDLNSSSLFGFGLNAWLDSACSVVVLWRFYGKDLYSETREKKACFIIGCFFLLLTLILAAVSVYNIGTHSLTTPDIKIIVLFIVCGVLNVVLATVKMYIGYKLESTALITDSFITYIGAFMSFAGLAALEKYRQHSYLWYLDPLIGIICSVILLSFSVRLIFKTLSIWRQS